MEQPISILFSEGYTGSGCDRGAVGARKRGIPPKTEGVLAPGAVAGPTKRRPRRAGPVFSRAAGFRFVRETDELQGLPRIREARKGSASSADHERGRHRIVLPLLILMLADRGFAG